MPKFIAIIETDDPDYDYEDLEVTLRDALDTVAHVDLEVVDVSFPYPWPDEPSLTPVMVLNDGETYTDLKGSSIQMYNPEEISVATIIQF